MELTVKLNKKELEEVIKEFLKAKNLTVSSIKFNVETVYEDRPYGGSYTDFTGVTATITKT